MIAWLIALWRSWQEPFDVLDSEFPGDLDCPETQPTSPGLLDEGHHVAP